MHTSLQHSKTESRIPTAAHDKNKPVGFIEHLDTLQDASITLAIMFKDRLDSMNDTHSTLRQNNTGKSLL